jgi:hypothetical protein
MDLAQKEGGSRGSVRPKNKVADNVDLFSLFYPKLLPASLFMQTFGQY